MLIFAYVHVRRHTLAEDRRTPVAHPRHEPREGAVQILGATEPVAVILLDVEHDREIGRERKERVSVLARLGDEEPIPREQDIAVKISHDPADMGGERLSRGGGDAGDHRADGRLAVGARHRNGFVEKRGYLGEKGRSRDRPVRGGDPFGIPLGDGGGVHREIGRGGTLGSAADPHVVAL